MFRQIEERMDHYMLPDEVYQIIEKLTLKVGGTSSSVQKQTKESLVGLLNKLTTDTYATISTKILASTPTTETLDELFKVASNNMFYSKVYARLCNQLVSMNESFRAVVHQKCSAFIGEASEVTLKHRGMTLFVTNLALNGTLPISEYVRLAHSFQDLVESNVQGDEDRVYEWTEHLALLLTVNKSLTDTCALEPRMKGVVELDSKNNKGITLKVVFKFMDILDHFK
jgi:hypothetical protein